MEDMNMDSSVDIADAPDRSSSPRTNGGGPADNLYLAGTVGDSNSPSLDMLRPETKFPQGGSENLLAEGGNQGNVPRNSGSYTCSSSTNSATARNNSKGKEKIEDIGFTGFGLVMDHAEGVDLSCGSPLILEPQLPGSHHFDVDSPRLVPNGFISPQNWGTTQFNEQAESSFKSEQNFGNIVSNRPCTDISEMHAEDGTYGYGTSRGPLRICPSRINIAQHLNVFALAAPSEMRGTTGSVTGEESSSSRWSRINIAPQVEADEVFALKLREAIWHLYEVPIQKVSEEEMRQKFLRVFQQEEDTVPTTSIRSESQPHQIDYNISRLLEGEDTTIFTRYVRILRQHRLRRSTRESRTQLLIRTSQTSSSGRGRGSAIRSRTRSPLRTFHTPPNRRRRLAGFATITMTQLGFNQQYRTLPSMTRNFFFPTDMNLDMRLNVIQAMEDFIEDDISGDTFRVQDFSDSDFERYLAQCENDEGDDESTDYSSSTSSSSSSDSETFSDSDDNNEEQSGLTTLQINNLPVSKVQIENSDDVCVICIESPVIGEIVRHLPCLHKFHKDCIDPWLGRKSSCPVCKSTIN